MFGVWFILNLILGLIGAHLGNDIAYLNFFCSGLMLALAVEEYKNVG